MVSDRCMYHAANKSPLQEVTTQIRRVHDYNAEVRSRDRSWK
jgi:hypothetical protein